jgi:uncharacterized protein involved in exopolysaccharide biosynthesis
MQNLRAVPGGESESSVRDILNVLFRHKWKMLLFFVVVFCLISLATLMANPVFESQAKLMIRMDRQVIGETVGEDTERLADVNSEASILQSRSLIEEVVDTLGPEKFLKGMNNGNGGKSTVPAWLKSIKKGVKTVVKAPRSFLQKMGLATKIKDRERAIKGLEKALLVRANKAGGNDITLTFQASDPGLAQLSLDTLIAAYQQQHLMIYETPITPKFFSEKAEALVLELGKKEDLREKYRKEHEIINEDEQRSKLMDQVGFLQIHADEVGGTVSSAKMRFENLEKALEGAQDRREIRWEKKETNDMIEATKIRLIDLRLAEVDLMNRYPDGAREIKDLRKQIVLAEKELDKEVKALEGQEIVVNALDNNVQMLKYDLVLARGQYKAVRAEYDSLLQSLEDRRQDLLALADTTLWLDRMQSDVDLAKKEYVEYRENLMRAELATALDDEKVTNVIIAQSATFSEDPVKPKKTLNVILGFLLALFGAIGLAFFSDYLDDSLKTNEDVARRLKLPVLASISARDFQKCT